MNIIRILPEQEALKIAAGEVIERPAHIVKELLENALDAHADTIDIYLEDAGKSLIRIVDNGHGMTPDDAALCFVKHATSKINHLKDLETINSFGFRGEALASIAAVSKVTLITKKSDATLATVLSYAQGAITQQEQQAHPSGTTFIIKDLFYSMPARKKFLRHNDTEIHQVVQLLYAAALSHLNVQFRLFIDNAIHTHAPKATSLQERMSQLWGYNQAQNMIPLIAQNHHKNHPWLTLEGMISSAQVWRYNRDRIFIFVNRRWVKDPDLSKAILKGYGNALPPGKFPISVLFISAEPDQVDVNVHPKKEEVRFIKPVVVQSSIQNGIQTSLEQHITRHLSTPQQETKAIVIESEKNPIDLQPVQRIINTPSFSAKSLSPIPTMMHDVMLNATITHHHKTEEQAEHHLRLLTREEQEPIQKKIIPTEHRPYKIIGQLFNTYIMLEKVDEFILIDQHAAHERVLYERWKTQFEGVVGISLIFPEIISVAPHHLPLLMEHHATFESLGIILEPFGVNQIIIKTAPPHVQQTALSMFVKEAAAFIDDHLTIEPHVVRKKLYEHMHSHMACKAAVKAGDLLSSSMIEQLIQDLLTHDNRYQCIHGRPTMWIISKLDFEKKFRRCS